MPAQSVQAALEVRAMRFMPVHWGAYALAVHAWDEPVQQSLPLARQVGLDMLTPLLGQVFDKHTVTVPWWQNLNNLQGAS